ncbi:Fibronectin type III domain-containing protein [Promicromonospora umidemergens]|uniref:Ig-like domain-containing protein n=1 Tax=Promicromonospora umidemergens TaxID=629679 RepID=A0ABP8X254_9MICO|nr:Ig-like domain-containing protein [Promicromonospora umidemergens]MCP2286101.1 Fibronectin type III domain-containing protein [Promicromonospora umidemergens]
MSFVSRVYENRRSAASIGAVTLFGAGLLGFALLYEGEATADVELNDSGVWVTQTASGKLGRFNYEAKALDGTLLANSTSFDVEQGAQRVLLKSGGDSSASPVDPALLALEGTMKFPAGAKVAAGGATTAVYDDETGRTWVIPFDGAVAFDEKEMKPVLKAGLGGEITVSNEGTVFLAVPSDGKLYTIPTGTQGVAEEPEESELPVKPDAEVQASAVGDEPVVLDESTGTLVLPGGDTVEIEDGAQGMLQQPSDDASNVALATTKGLVTQPLDGGEATTRTSSGNPSAPVQLSGCTYGAWSGSGQVVRDCPGPDNDVDQVLEGVDAAATLVYRVNRNVIVLNDVADGSLWMAADEFEKVDDWDLKMPEDEEGEKTESEDTTPEHVDQFVAERDQANRPPEPKPDRFGVRPGRTTVLNVLGNDFDRDGDVMTASVKGEAKGDITVDRVLNGAALQANVPPDATGTTSFDYEVDDGRENGTATSSVDVKVVPLEENNPPAQTGKPVLQVGQDGLGTIKVLPYFKDPDGDDLFLSNASTADKRDEVRFRPDGTIEFRDGGAATGHKIVDVTVSDAMDTLVEGTLIVDVVATNVKPVPVQDHVTVLAGEPVTVNPLQNDFDPNGDKIRMTSVAEVPSATVEQNQTAGSFNFTSDKVGSHDVIYQITDGPNAPVMGLVRVDVTDPADEARSPVAVSDQVLLPTGGTALVDVLANDTDPTGGVLVVKGIDVPSDAPVSVSVLNHQILKVSEIKRLDEPVVLSYKVANGSGTVAGQLRVVPIPAPAQLRPPEAGPDEATVHAGDVVTIPVLKNDTHPDGLEMTITDELQESPPAEAGEAFVSEDSVRFRAAKEAGTYHAVYEVEDSNGQKDSAQITVHVVDAPENGAPQLPDVEARVLSGGIVRIPLPLDGTDPDGDYVTLSSVSGAPSQGRATIVDGFIDYQAAEDASGLDTFTYQVMDTRGAPAEGTVRVGVARPPASNQEPQAIDDETTVRPGRTVAVAALDNDSDPDGDQIGLVAKGFEGNDSIDPRAVDDDVVVEAPGDEGAYSFYYGVQDTFKARASGAITVNVDQDAPLLRPVAHDDVVTADDVEGASSVTVKVLDNDVDPDGVAADLGVAVDESLEGVTVTESGSVEVQLTERARVITYTVTDMDGLEAKAFVRVPGDQSRPHVKPGQGPLKATSGEPLTIDLAKYVVVREDREPRITEENTVKAVEGTVSATDHDTVVYTSVKDYAGAASVSFEVTDGDGPDDAEGLTAVLTLPIDVTPAKNLPPKVTGTPVLQVAAGEEATVDLSRYVTDPDKDPLEFDVTAGDGISTSVSGATVTGQAEKSVSKGTFRELPVTVSDGLNRPVRTKLTVEVMASTRPLVQTTEDVVRDAHQGEATTVPVLANDTNPFPEDELTLSGTPTVDTGAGTASYSGNQLVVTPAEDFTGAMLVRYRVQDATKDPDREVDGIAKLTVLGKPEAPRAPRVEEVRSETVVLTWDQPNNNGSDITAYTLKTNTGQEHECSTTTCTFDGLQNNVKYTFTVTATNDVGESDPSPASREARPDEKPDKPAPPSLEFGDSELTVTWKNRAYTDRSPIECVNLEISPPPNDGPTQKTCLEGGQTVWDGLQNGTAYTVSVQAKNDAPDPSDWSDPSVPETPAAPPAAPAAPTAKRVETAAGGQIIVNWNAPANNGDAIDEYWLGVYTGGELVKSINTAETTQPVQELSNKSTYTFRVRATNKAGDGPASPFSNAVEPYGEPVIPGTPEASLGTNTSGQADVEWSGTSDYRGTGGYHEVQASDGTLKNTGNDTSTTFSGLNNGTSYTFRVRACNSGECSPWTASSNAVVPYGPVPTPTISADGGNQQVSFSWDGTETNGRAIRSVRVTGAITSSATSGSETASAGYSDTKEACVEVTDTEGQKASDCASGTSAAKPNPSAYVSHGSSVNNNQCEHSSCAFFRVNWSDFEPGNHSVECWSGTNPDESGWHNILTPDSSQSVNFGAVGDSGTFQLNCFYGYPNTDVAVRIDGVRYEARRW